MYYGGSYLRRQGQTSVFENVLYRGPDSPLERLLLDWLRELEFRSYSG